ncbi:MAG: cation transporter [Candidatus Omnitrophica bacterium]|nr:cation transporter [Candidatus Omnitrophota bacterium]
MTSHPQSIGAASHGRWRQIAAVLWVTLLLNWAVALLKLLFGWATHCMVIVADGLHSLSDGTSNIVGLVGISLSKHPADHDHPYGHRKYETFAAVVISFFLFIVSFGVLRESVLGWVRQRTPEVNAMSFALMGLTLCVNLFVVVYERRKAFALKSDLLMSDSWHTLSDVFITLSVAAALVGIRLKVPRLDALFSFVIAFVIFSTAVRILKRGSDVLCDRAVLDTQKVEHIARRVEGVLDCHEIRTRGRVDDVYVDLHILVDPQMSVFASHGLANIIERDIKREIPGVTDVVVHVEPLSHDHEELKG